MKNLIQRYGRAIAATSIAAASIVAASNAPAHATVVGDSKLVQLDPESTTDARIDNEVALQAWGTGDDGTGEGANVRSSSEWRNAPSQKWKMKVVAIDPYSYQWKVTFQSTYAYSGGAKCMQSSDKGSGSVTLHTCANTDTQKFWLIKRSSEADGDTFWIQNVAFPGQNMDLNTLLTPFSLLLHDGTLNTFIKIRVLQSL